VFALSIVPGRFVESISADLSLQMVAGNRDHGGAHARLLGEGQQHRFVGEEKVEQPEEKGTIARHATDLMGANPGFRKEAAEVLWILGEKTQYGSGDSLGFRKVGFTALHEVMSFSCGSIRHFETNFR
jgi:hypothetical protein